MSFCEIILVGNVGRDPELKYTPSGAAVAKFSLAVGRSWTDNKTNERRESTTWFTINVWGQQAETVNQYVQKGKQVLVVGDRIEVDVYTGNDGQPRSSINITARTVRFLSGGNGGGGRQGGYDEYDAMPPGGTDDIPF